MPVLAWQGPALNGHIQFDKDIQLLGPLPTDELRHQTPAGLTRRTQIHGVSGGNTLNFTYLGVAAAPACSAPQHYCFTPVSGNLRGTDGQLVLAFDLAYTI